MDPPEKVTKMVSFSEELKQLRQATKRRRDRRRARLDAGGNPRRRGNPPKGRSYLDSKPNRQGR